MNRFLSRIVALILVPCLVGASIGPVGAGPSPRPQSEIRFTSQALEVPDIVTGPVPLADQELKPPVMRAGGALADHTPPAAPPSVLPAEAGRSVQGEKAPPAPGASAPKIRLPNDKRFMSITPGGPGDEDEPARLRLVLKLRDLRQRHQEVSTRLEKLEFSPGPLIRISMKGLSRARRRSGPLYFYCASTFGVCPALSTKVAWRVN